MTTTPELFDLAGPLPADRSTTLLEASAGTGKTYTIAGLVVRLVAEGLATLDEVLVVTFGRAASHEVRSRVREALVDAERVLADPTTARADDVVHRLLLALPEPAAARERLRTAVTGYDAATIATTHQFCHAVLRSLGVAGDVDPAVTLLEDLDDLRGEVTDDLYVREYSGQTNPLLEHHQAVRIAKQAIEDSHATLTPDHLDPGTAAGQALRFAHLVRDEMDRRKRELRVLHYDDLLSRLADALSSGPMAAQRMRSRWRVVLIDEFQDTDPAQWQVIERAFAGHSRVVLIGDPKQAIYAFRGGDITTYLTAAATADARYTLGANHRSDPALVRALGAALGGAALGDERIRVHEVLPALTQERLRGAPHAAPFRLRIVTRADLGCREDRTPAIDDVRAHIARDCAADIAALLSSGATWDGQPIAAHHVAVLSRKHQEGALVARELVRLGIPCVSGGSGHVATTDAGRHWLTLLEALDAPHRTGLARAAALTPFFGITASDLDAHSDERTDDVADRLRSWAIALRRSGAGAVLEAAEESGMGARVLRQVGGERLLTDLRHIAQLLHAHGRRGGGSIAGLAAWLREQARDDKPTEDRTRRLDSDAAAVQILTIHASKGLQFPVVYVPFEFERFVPDADKTGHLLLHDEAGTRLLDITGLAGRTRHEAFPAHLQRHQDEEAAEALRQTYVALTRAQSQVVTWWAPTYNTKNGPLHRLLVGRTAGQSVGPVSPVLPSDTEAWELACAWGAAGGPAAERSTISEAVAPPRVTVLGHPEVRPFGRAIDTEWRRTSYSGLIRVEQTALPGVMSEPESAGIDDETPAEPDGPTLPEDPTDEGIISPMADLPAGAAFGSLVHAVLEQTDPQSPDLRAALRAAISEQQVWWPVDVDADVLADALLPMQHTSLGPLAGGLTLADVPLTDRLRELDFEIPLAGGDTGAGRPARLRELAPLLHRHLPVQDPLARYAARLTEAPLGDQLLSGYLSGSIDAVLRLPGPRFLVVDYKSNLLGDGERTTTADYTQERMADAMLHSHYPLQALLYCVVVHRLLRWRQAGYDPSEHLGGVLYLFVRGMVGPGTPAPQGIPTGVFTWKPPVELVLELSDLLDGSLLAEPEGASR